MWIRFKIVQDYNNVSWRYAALLNKKLTCNAGEELPGKALDLTVWKRYKGVAFEKIKNTLPKQIHNYANMASVIKAVTKVYAPVSVLVVICFEGRQDPQLYP